MIGNVRQHVAQVRFRVPSVQFGRPDQAIEGGGALAANLQPSTPSL